MALPQIGHDGGSLCYHCIMLPTLPKHTLLREMEFLNEEMRTMYQQTMERTEGFLKFGDFLQELLDQAETDDQVELLSKIIQALP